MNLYRILELEDDCSESEVRKAYLRLAILHHPDRDSSENARTKFQEIHNAYVVLSDPVARTEYDMLQFHEFAFDRTASVEQCIATFRDIFPSIDETWLEHVPDEWLSHSQTAFDGIVKTPNMRIAIKLWTSLPDGAVNLQTIAEKISKAFNGGDDGSTRKHDGDENTEIMSENVVQTIRVPLIAVYRREIKKISVCRYRWDEESKTRAKESKDFLVPLEHTQVAYRGEGDSDTSAHRPGDLVFLVECEAEGQFFRDRSSRLMRCHMELHLLEAHYGTKRVLEHPSGVSLHLNIGEKFHERMHDEVKVDGLGFWDAGASEYGVLLISFSVEETTADLEMSERDAETIRGIFVKRVAATPRRPQDRSLDL
jgi:DnaJ-class molecular chaperone